MTTAANACESYVENGVLTANPAELTLMLYDGCIKFLKQARLFIDRNDINKAHNAFVRAQDIITELVNSLNMGYGISENLVSIYEYMLNQIINANVEKNAALTEPVIELLVDLRDTWQKAMKLSAR